MCVCVSKLSAAGAGVSILHIFFLLKQFQIHNQNVLKNLYFWQN